MKPENFPERKNRRQKTALRKLLEVEEPNKRQKREIERLKERVSPSKRHQKSKIFRG